MFQIRTNMAIIYFEFTIFVLRNVTFLININLHEHELDIYDLHLNYKVLKFERF